MGVAVEVLGYSVVVVVVVGSVVAVEVADNMGFFGGVAFVGTARAVAGDSY